MEYVYLLFNFNSSEKCSGAAQVVELLAEMRDICL